MHSITDMTGQEIAHGDLVAFHRMKELDTGVLLTVQPTWVRIRPHESNIPGRPPAIVTKRPWAVVKYRKVA